jgi:hypothetical protein
VHLIAYAPQSADATHVYQDIQATTVFAFNALKQVASMVPVPPVVVKQQVLNSVAPIVKQ